MITHQPQPQTAGSSANQQRPEEEATIPRNVLTSKPGSFFIAQHQESDASSTAPLHLVAFPVPYSSSVDMFCQIHPTHLSSMNYPLAPMLVPLTCTGSNPSQIPPSYTQRPNDGSPDAAFSPASIPRFLGPSSVCSHTPASCLPVFSVLPAQGLYLSHGSDSSLVQNKAPEASSDPVLVRRPAASDRTVAEPPSFRLPAAERYTELWMFFEFYCITPQCMVQKRRLTTIKMSCSFTFLPWPSNSLKTPLEDSTDPETFESNGRLTDHNADDHKLYSQAAESLKAAQTRLDLPPPHRCCAAVLDGHEVNFSVTPH